MTTDEHTQAHIDALRIQADRARARMETLMDETEADDPFQFELSAATADFMGKWARWRRASGNPMRINPA